METNISMYQILSVLGTVAEGRRGQEQGGKGQANPTHCAAISHRQLCIHNILIPTYRVLQLPPDVRVADYCLSAEMYTLDKYAVQYSKCLYTTFNYVLTHHANLCNNCCC